MVTVALVDTILSDLVEMNRHFMDVAMGDGLAPVLLVVGGLITAFAIVVMAVLGLGAFGSLFISD